MERLPAALRGSAAASLASAVAVLDDRLLRPMRIPPGAPVVLVPTGALATLPWGLLPSLRGRPVSVAPSVGSWHRARTGAGRPAPRPEAGVVAVAGPGLRRADDEIAEVASAWPGCVTLRGPNATGAAVLSALDGARLVHFAAHGRHEPDSPLFSSLGLADGPLVGYDLDGVVTPPTQVVLSACELGLATIRAGDEALGLTRALLHSGTSTVIAGVARVSDDVAADVMAAYHRRLASGAGPAEALADALPAAPDRPAPFVCFGAG
jgi:hypothetical protein